MDPRFTTGRSPSTGSDIDHMPEIPQRGTHHRRSHSDTSFRFAASNLDDLLFFDASDFNFSDFASPTTLTPTPVDVSATRDNPMVGDSPVTSKSYMSSDESTGQPLSNPGQTQPPLGHLRSLSVDSDFFEGLSLNDGYFGKFSGAKRTAVHRHSSSMDGTTSMTASLEAESSMGLVVDGAKKALGSDKLADLALVDPKRARRILANRQSAARSKERKIRYTSELERKVQTIQSEATTLSAQVTKLQRETNGLTAENKELKLRLEAMKQQAKLKDALTDALREELQHLKILAGRVAAVSGNLLNGGLPPQLSSFQTGSRQLGNPQGQQAIEQAGGLSPLWSSDNQGFNRQPQPSILNSKQRTN